MSKILCGSACVKYILDYYNIYNKINLNMKWVPELALALEENGFNIKIFCYKSKLYNDYFLLNNEDVIAFKYIAKLEEKTKIKEKKLDVDELKKEVSKYGFIVLCVDSKIFNTDINMHGGHYIILNGFLCDKLKVINPTKKGYDYMALDALFLVQCCHEYGNWRILIGGYND